MMGVVSSKSSSLSLVSSGTAIHEVLERMASLEQGNEDAYDEDGAEEMTTERQREIAMREQIAESLLRKSSSHLLVTANSSIDHLHFIRSVFLPSIISFPTLPLNLNALCCTIHVCKPKNLNADAQ